MKRPNLDSYFMNIAYLVATRSTCLHRQVGAVIVKGKQIVSTGYNGAPQGLDHCSIVGCPREGIPSGERHELCRGAHAEQNSISFAARFGIPVEDCVMYTTVVPCSWCARSIVNAGIKEVVYHESYDTVLSEGIMSNISLRQLKIFESL